MALDLIRIRNLRNISEASLEPSAGINIFEGPNGSGKTSLLEAIYLLGRGRSFRGNRIASVIQKNKQTLELYCEAENHKKSVKIGLRKTTVATDVKINGVRINKLSLLARELPLHLITPRSHEIIEGKADYRRRFLEWGVFHVEPRYQYYSARYQRVLAQRNAALKRDVASVDHWNIELARCGDELNQMRLEYLRALEPILIDELQYLIPNISISLSWKQGWDQNTDLIDSLTRNRERDIHKGYTSGGPHRADLVIMSSGEPASRILSRGQQKLIVIGLILSQSKLLKNITGMNPIIMVDDLESELDQTNKISIVQRLIAQNTQVIITRTDNNRTSNYQMDKLFHVEHGAVSEERV